MSVKALVLGILLLSAVAADAAGNLYVFEHAGRETEWNTGTLIWETPAQIYKITSDGALSAFADATDSGFGDGYGLTAGADGAIYLADTQYHLLWRFGGTSKAVSSDATCALGHVELDADTLMLGEGAGRIEIPLIQASDPVGALSLEYTLTTVDGTAPLYDWAGTGGTLSWDAEVGAPSIMLDLLDDGLPEVRENFVLTLLDTSVSPPAVIDRMDISVIDDDLPDLGAGIAIGGSVPQPRLFGGLNVDDAAVAAAEVNWHITRELILYLELNQLADTAPLSVVLYDVEDGRFLMRDQNGQWLPWNLKTEDLAWFVPTVREGGVRRIPLHPGLAEQNPGSRLQLFFGYHGADGTIVFNGAQPLGITVSREAAGRLSFTGETYYCQAAPGSIVRVGAQDLELQGSISTYVRRTGGAGGAVGVSYGTAYFYEGEERLFTSPEMHLTWAAGDSRPKPLRIDVFYIPYTPPLTLSLFEPEGGAGLGAVDKLEFFSAYDGSQSLDELFGTTQCPPVPALTPLPADLPSAEGLPYIFTADANPSALDEARAFLYPDGRLFVLSVDVPGLGLYSADLQELGNGVFEIVSLDQTISPAWGTYFDPGTARVTVPVLHRADTGCHAATLVLGADGLLRMEWGEEVTCR